MTTTGEDAPPIEGADVGLLTADNVRDAVLVSTLRYALSHFLHLDNSNAAIHCSTPRFSPITFRLAEALALLGREGDNDVDVVLEHRGTYKEDRGR